MSNFVTLAITGDKIMEALYKLSSKRSIAEDAFQEIIKQDNCSKGNAFEAMDRLLKVERDIAFIQTLQTQYNLSVLLKTSEGKDISLTEAVKRIGGEARSSQLWKNITNHKLRKKFGTQLKFEDAVLLSSGQQSAVRQLRTAIEKANSTPVSMSAPVGLFD